MKKRILFVDDEPLILQGLQRMLRPIRQEWEMDFAEGAARALQCMATTAYDVVISDMVMPGMDGSQLLKEVQRTSPQTIRLILSGHADQKHAMKCVGLAHQYLSKPADADSLKALLSRVTSVEFTARNESILRLLPQLERLPSIPAVYSEIVGLLKDPDVCMEDVGGAIAKDIAITAQILQVVNSSFFGMPHHISDPVEAASYLGVETVKALVLATSVFSQFRSEANAEFSVEALARHSQWVGATARIIARKEGASQLIINESLVAGLLHDAGKLILVANLPQRFKEAAHLGKEKGLLEAEREIFGATHAEVAGYLLGLWGLPAPVVEAIAFHHTPLESQRKGFWALTAVHVADALAWEHTLSVTAKATIDMDYLEGIGLAERLPIWRSGVEEYFSNISQAHDFK